MSPTDITARTPNKIPFNKEDSQIGKRLNELVKRLNAIFKTVHHIVSKYSKKGKTGFAPFLFEIGKSFYQRNFKVGLKQAAIFTGLFILMVLINYVAIYDLLTYVKDAGITPPVANLTFYLIYTSYNCCIVRTI